MKKPKTVQEKIDWLRKQGGKDFLVTSDEEHVEIPFCLCCEYKLFQKDELPSKKRFGRFLLGAVPFCKNCEDNCLPEESFCKVDRLNGRIKTMSEVMDWIMDE